MTAKPIYLMDASSARFAVLNVSLADDAYHGTICLDGAAPELVRLFEEFEAAVEGQMFGLVDEIERKIGAIWLTALSEDAREARVEDLQVYPSTKRVSFRIRQEWTTAKAAHAKISEELPVLVRLD
jgi:hypothetical protein